MVGLEQQPRLAKWTAAVGGHYQKHLLHSVSQKNNTHMTFDHNFSKYRPIYKILSLSDSEIPEETLYVGLIITWSSTSL